MLTRRTCAQKTFTSFEPPTPCIIFSLHIDRTLQVIVIIVEVLVCRAFAVTTIRISARFFNFILNQVITSQVLRSRRSKIRYLLYRDMHPSASKVATTHDKFWSRGEMAYNTTLSNIVIWKIRQTVVSHFALNALGSVD